MPEKNITRRGTTNVGTVCVAWLTMTPRMTAQKLVNEFVTVLYSCHSDVQLFRPTSVDEMAANTMDMIRTTHSFIEYSKDAAPSWVFCRTRYVPSDTHHVVGIGGFEI